MVEVEKVNDKPVRYVGGECIVPAVIQNLSIDENQVEEINFPANQCGVMRLTLGRSGHFAAALVDTGSESSVLFEEGVLGKILLSGDWTCKNGPKGSMTLIRQEAPAAAQQSIWSWLLEAHHMNKGPSRRQKAWGNVSEQIQQRPRTVNNVLRFLNRRIGL